MKRPAKVVKINQLTKLNYTFIVNILEFFAKSKNESLHVIVSTDFNEYKFKVFKNAQLNELKTTKSLTVVTIYYQSILSRVIEKKMQIIIL